MTEVIDLDGGDVKRRACRELKYFGNMLKGVLAVVDDVESWADAEKRVADLKKREIELQTTIATLEAKQQTLAADVAVLEAKHGAVAASIAAVLQKLGG